MKAFAWSARQSDDGQRDYGPYLFTIAGNVLADRGRHTGREIPTGSAELAALADEPQDGVENECWAQPSAVAIVARYLAGLDPQLRAVHDRRYVEGLSQHEAARELGLSWQQVRTLEEHLRQGVRERWLQSLTTWLRRDGARSR